MRPDRSLDSHVPPRPARRDGGRHSTQPRTTLVGGADRADSYPAYAGYPDPVDVYASYGDAAGGSYPGPAGGSYPGPAGGSYPGPADGSYPGPADGAEDTLVLGRLRGPGEPPPARLPSRRSPAGTAGRIAVTACGVAVVAFAGFRLVPPVMQHLGIGTPAPGPGPCATCLGPIPSSSPLPQAPSATPSTTRARAAPPARRTPAAAVVTAPVTPAPSASASATVPTSPGAPPGVTYRVTAQAGGGFTSQIIVVNHGTAPVSNWQLVVALPLDSVSAVQNAAYSYDSDVVFATPAPGEPPIAPGGTLVVTIDASGPTVTPADCSFDNVACQ